VHATTLPLIAAYHPSAVLAWREDGPVTQSEFVAEAMALSRHLPQGRHAINLCEDRYRFMLGLAAVCLRGQTNLLPASTAPAMIETLLRSYPDSYVLNDAMAQARGDKAPARSPRIADDHVAAIAFTSGSTGAPQPHAKTWRVLARTAQLARKVFLPGAETANIVATVPAQHMYGLETTVFFALAAGCASHHGKPFFPADLRDALAAVPAPRLLISTPVHLRALVTAGIALPELRLIISATAPLTPELATQAEETLHAPVHEIYGCTEAGSMASRRSCETDRWQLHPRMRIEQQDGKVHISGAHLPEEIPVNDRVEISSTRRFRLLGRNADLLKVAGKRASLSDLTQKLLAVPGVEDGVLFMPDDAARPAALVVAPRLAESEILAALAPQVDAVFLPRPLRKVERLPRNELGKLPHARLMELLAK
jgi:acyl-coenzyme A synthetase/AMP-(fatty) acid ligase